MFVLRRMSNMNQPITYTFLTYEAFCQYENHKSYTYLFADDKERKRYNYAVNEEQVKETMLKILKKTKRGLTGEFDFSTLSDEEILNHIKIKK